MSERTIETGMKMLAMLQRSSFRLFSETLEELNPYQAAFIAMLIINEVGRTQTGWRKRSYVARLEDSVREASEFKSAQKQARCFLRIISRPGGFDDFMKSLEDFNPGDAACVAYVMTRELQSNRQDYPPLTLQKTYRLLKEAVKD